MASSGPFLEIDIVKMSTSPNTWQPPQWHPDFGDPISQLEPLRAFSQRLLLAEPKAIVVLEAPEPGLLYVRGILPNAKMFEVHSVPSPQHFGMRRLGVFMNPDTDHETERYFDLPDEAIAFLNMEP